MQFMSQAPIKARTLEDLCMPPPSHLQFHREQFLVALQPERVPRVSSQAHPGTLAYEVCSSPQLCL